MYRYETHLHTKPCSKCGKTGVRETLEAYKRWGYDGVFITNHFIEGNTTVDKELPYEERIRGHFLDVEEGRHLAKEVGIKVFSGVEMNFQGADFLVYGLEKDWYLMHPELLDMKMSERLSFLAEAGALIIHAHPFREKKYIDHIHLFPRHVHGVEVLNACNTRESNVMAEVYAKHYGLLPFAGSDNHNVCGHQKLSGMESETPAESAQDFIRMFKAGRLQIFYRELDA